MSTSLENNTGEGERNILSNKLHNKNYSNFFAAKAFHYTSKGFILHFPQYLLTILKHY